MDKLLRSLGGIRENDGAADALFGSTSATSKSRYTRPASLVFRSSPVVDTICSPDGNRLRDSGNDDAMRAILLYAGGVAESVLEGKASLPEGPGGRRRIR